MGKSNRQCEEALRREQELVADLQNKLATMSPTKQCMRFLLEIVAVMSTFPLWLLAWSYNMLTLPLMHLFSGITFLWAGSFLFRFTRRSRWKGYRWMGRSLLGLFSLAGIWSLWLSVQGWQ